MRRILSSGAVRAALLVLLFASSGCAHDVQRIVSTDIPGYEIVEIPYGADRGFYTALFSNPLALQSGVDGRTLAVTAFTSYEPRWDQMTIDFAGDVGLRGDLHAKGSIATVSHRAEKTRIRAFHEDALRLLDTTTIVTYRYRGEPTTHDRHIGFIAEDAPPELGGAAHDRYDVTNAASIDLAATKQLRRRVVRLESLVRDLRRRLRVTGERPV